MDRLNKEKEELEERIKIRRKLEEGLIRESEKRKMLCEEDDDDEDENYIGKRAKHFKELYEKRPEDETEINEEKKEIPVKKDFDVNRLWNDSEENLKDSNLLDKFELEEIKEDKETLNNFTPVKDDFEEFKPEVKEENEKMVIDFEPSNSDFPDLKIEFNKEDN